MRFLKFIIISVSLPTFMLGMNLKQLRKPLIIPPKYNASSELKRYCQPIPCPSVPKVIEDHHKSDSIFNSIIKEYLQDCGLDQTEKDNLSNIEAQVETMPDNSSHDAINYGKNLLQLYVGNDARVLKYMLAHTIIDVVTTKSTIDALEQENKLVKQELKSMEERSHYYESLAIASCLTVGYLLCAQTNS